MNVQRRRAGLLGMALAVASVVVLSLGLGIGSTGFESVLALRHDAIALQIVWDIRLPRTLGAWLAGTLLGLAGAVAQGLFRNPLADPYLLGSASGASLGVAVALLAFGHTAPGSIAGMQWLMRLGLTGAAFVGAVLAVLLTLSLARGVAQSLRLLLAGVIVGVVLGATKDLVVLGSADVLTALTGFMLGSTGLVGWSACAVMAATAALCLACAWAMAPVLDGLALGESTAASLGLPLGAMRVALVAVLALATGAAVAQTGLIAFVGLAAPHLVRSAVKTTHAGLVVLSTATGGLLLMAADLLARWLIAPQELPVGILTAVLGGSYLLYLMHRRA